MHHARRLYKSASKKQHRQMMCPTIPNVREKKLREKKSYDADHPRHFPDLQHQHEQQAPGGPVSNEGMGLRQAMRVAQEIHHGPQGLCSSD
jgi:hypothetical protein